MEANFCDCACGMGSDVKLTNHCWQYILESGNGRRGFVWYCTLKCGVTGRMQNAGADCCEIEYNRGSINVNMARWGSWRIPLLTPKLGARWGGLSKPNPGTALPDKSAGTDYIEKFYSCTPHIHFLSFNCRTLELRLSGRKMSSEKRATSVVDWTQLSPCGCYEGWCRMSRASQCRFRAA
jgi:hypothetical protein